MMETKGRFGSVIAASLAALVVAGCTALNEPELFEKKFWEGGAAKDNTFAELGLAELAKGNPVEAEHYFQQALKSDQHDVYALMGLGILYQNTGQTLKARTTYETLIALNPDRDEQFVPWTSAQPKPIADIATYNLAVLEKSAPASAAAPAATAAALRAAPNAAATLERPAAGQEPLASISKGEANIESRFLTLAALRDQGLITPQEYAQRRQANVGALLPLTSPPPAAGLDRPVPSTDQVVGRLQAIGKALEMRAMSVAQHASERGVILDALMPAAPVVVANPGPPPQGMMEAADAVRRLDQAKADKLITADEYTKERAAIDRAGQPAKSASVAGTTPVEAGSLPQAEEGSQPGVHLASFRSAKEAEHGWDTLKRKYPSLLGTLKAETPRVDLGPGKGVFYRLKVGPLASKQAARDLCRKLEAQKQYCEPTMF